LGGDAAAGDDAAARRFGWVWPAVAASVTVGVALAAWMSRGPSAGTRVAEKEMSPVESMDSRPPGGAREASGTMGDVTAPGPTGEATAHGGASAGAPRIAAARAGGRRDGGSLATGPTGVARDGTLVAPVIVPAGEAEALVRLAALVRSGRHAPAALVAAGQPALDLSEPAALDITPLEIVPLDPAENPGTPEEGD
jgi:hypothetical protein